MRTDRAVLGGLLKEARHATGVTQAQLAIRTGMAAPAISRIENGRESPSFERFASCMEARRIPSTSLQKRRRLHPSAWRGCSSGCASAIGSGVPSCALCLVAGADVLEDLPSELDRGALDPVRIFEALQRHEVEYLTIGGVAVNAHGHVRNTRDVDILIEWTAENMRRLAAALTDLDAKLFGVDADLIDVDPLDPQDLLNGGNFTLRTAAGGLDLFDPDEIPGGRPYDEMRPRAVEAIVDGVGIRAVGFDDLIRLKREAGRDRDLEDVSTLLAAKRLSP